MADSLSSLPNAVSAEKRSDKHASSRVSHSVGRNNVGDAVDVASSCGEKLPGSSIVDKEHFLTTPSWNGSGQEVGSVCSVKRARFIPPPRGPR